MLGAGAERFFDGEEDEDEDEDDEDEVVEEEEEEEEEEEDSESCWSAEFFVGGLRLVFLFFLFALFLLLPELLLLLFILILLFSDINVSTAAEVTVEGANERSRRMAASRGF